MRRIAALLLLMASAASAGERFGEKGTISPSGSVTLGFFGSGSNGSGFAPAAMFFVADGLAVGGSALLFYNSGGSYSVASYGIAPSVGWNAWVRDRLSFFPQISLQVIRTQLISGGDVRTDELQTRIYLPFLLHVTPHFFIGLGPSATIELASRTRGSSPFGTGFASNGSLVLLNSVIGGWF